MIELKMYDGWDCHVIYDVLIDGVYRNQVEVQFNDGKFNGKILQTVSENEDGEFEWEFVEENTELYNTTKEKAISDYNK